MVVFCTGILLLALAKPLHFDENDNDDDDDDDNDNNHIIEYDNIKNDNSNKHNINTRPAIVAQRYACNDGRFGTNGRLY